MTIYILSISVVWSRGGPGWHCSWCGHISIISLVGGLWVQADWHGAAGAALVFCGVPVDGEVVVAGATGALCTGGDFGTGGDFCMVKWFLHWRCSRPFWCSGSYITRWGCVLPHGLSFGVPLTNVIPGLSVSSSANDFNQVGSVVYLLDDSGR